MSYNQNGYADPSKFLLGIGEIWVNKEYCGALSGSVTLNSKREFAYARPGHMIADLKAEVTNEEVTLEAEVCELKVDQLRLALGINQAVDRASAKEIRVTEQLQLVGTTAETMTKTAITPSIKVMKLDRSKTYALTTDYTVATNKITRVAGGTIADGEVVVVEYNYSDATAKSVAFGGEITLPPSFEVIFSIVNDQGKHIQITMFKAIAITELEMAFNERSSGDYTVHNLKFRGMADLTKSQGAQIYEVVEESAA